MVDWYKVLGVDPTAKQNEIKRAYLRLLKKYHPDRTTVDATEAHETTVKLNRAYQILGDEETRRKYDAYRKKSKKTPNPSPRSTANRPAKKPAIRLPRPVLTIPIIDFGEVAYTDGRLTRSVEVQNHGGDVSSIRINGESDWLTILHRTPANQLPLRFTVQADVSRLSAGRHVRDFLTIWFNQVSIQLPVEITRERKPIPPAFSIIPVEDQSIHVQQLPYQIQFSVTLFQGEITRLQAFCNDKGIGSIEVEPVNLKEWLVTIEIIPEKFTIGRHEPQIRLSDGDSPSIDRVRIPIHSRAPTFFERIFSTQTSKEKQPEYSIKPLLQRFWWLAVPLVVILFSIMGFQWSRTIGLDKPCAIQQSAEGFTTVSALQGLGCNTPSSRDAISTWELVHSGIADSDRPYTIGKYGEEVWLATQGVDDNNAPIVQIASLTKIDNQKAIPSGKADPVIVSAETPLITTYGTDIYLRKIDGSPVKKIETAVEINGIDVSKRSDLILGWSANVAFLFDAQTGRGIKQYLPLASIQQAELSPQSTYVAVTTTTGNSYLYNAQQGTQQRLFEPISLDGVRYIPIETSISADEKKIAIVYITPNGSQSMVRIYSTQSGSSLGTYEGGTFALFNPVYAYVLIGQSNGTMIYETNTLTSLGGMYLHKSAQFSADGKYLISQKDRGQKSNQVWQIAGE